MDISIKMLPRITIKVIWKLYDYHFKSENIGCKISLVTSYCSANPAILTHRTNNIIDGLDLPITEWATSLDNNRICVVDRARP